MTPFVMAVMVAAYGIAGPPKVYQTIAWSLIYSLLRTFGASWGLPSCIQKATLVDKDGNALHLDLGAVAIGGL